MKISNIIYISLFISLLWSCNSDVKEPEIIHPIFSGYAEGNIYTDTLRQTIYELAYNRDFEKVKAELNAEYFKYPKYKKEALETFASVQDSGEIIELAKYFTDSDFEIRKAAAFAIGQTRNKSAEKLLFTALKNEPSPAVKEEILIAIGKCAGKDAFEKIAGMPVNSEFSAVNFGIITALEKFAERGIWTDAGTQAILSVLRNKNISEDIKFTASYALYRAKTDLNNYSGKLISAYNRVDYIYTKAALIKAIAYSQTPEVLNFLKAKLTDNLEISRIKLNCINALKSFDYKESDSLMFNFLDYPDAHIANAAADFMVSNGIEEDVPKYLIYAQKSTSKIVKSKLFTAALRYGKDKSEISELIKTEIKNSTDSYEKAALLQALGEDVSQYRYVTHETFFAQFPVISTAGISALSNMRYSADFDAFAKSHPKMKLYDAFADIFKKAILSGDVALVSIAAQTIRDERFNYAELYDNTYFIKQSIKKCVLPRDIEAYTELIKTDAAINGTEYDDLLPDMNYYQPNWEFIQAIPAAQKVKFITDKGDFVIQLDVNAAPVTVAAFLNLIVDDYFNDKVFHRVVSDFVVQTGCPRGDGWGTASYSLRSEFTEKPFVEGAVGMASSGKDTESTQWFVMLAPAPHLDGRYTNFGTVTEGLDVIHRLQVGDKIIKAELL